MAQGRHWVNAHRTSGRYVASGQCNERQQQRCASIRERVRRANAYQIAADRARRAHIFQKQLVEGQSLRFVVANLVWVNRQIEDIVRVEAEIGALRIAEASREKARDD